MIEKINSKDNNKYKEFNKKFHKFITEKYTIKDVLKDLKRNIKGAKNIRFRPVDWQEKALVYVSGFSTEKEENVDPCLYRRVFLDSRDDTHLSKIDALSGLEARKAFIDTEENRLDEDLKRKLKRDYDLNTILKESFKRLKADKKKYNDKKKIWGTFYDDIKNNLDIEKYMQKPPWKNGEKWPWQLMSKEKLLKNKKELLGQVEKTYKYYSDLEEQWQNYYSDLIKIWEKYLIHYDIDVDELIHDQNSMPKETISGSTMPVRAPEIAVPVKTSEKFFGILSYYRDNSFSEDEMVNELNEQYSSILAVICLRNQSELLRDLQIVTETMARESDLERIATEIARGIRGAFFGFKKEDVFPLLCICNEPIVASNNLEKFVENWEDSYQKRQEPKKNTPNDEKDHKLWDIEEKLAHIPIRENGLGRKAIEKWQTEMRNSKSPQARNYFTISPDVDNPDSITGNIQALNLGIRTTGCLPLFFDRQIYGLLYLHCKERHFFTATELEALETFGSQAAIAIKNYKLVGDSYEKLYGSVLLDRLEEIQEDEVGKKINKWAIQIRNARAGDISRITKESIKDLANYYKLPNTFVIGIGEREMHEVTLQAIPDYRDHFIHTFHVFCLGYCIIHEWEKQRVNPLKINLKSWFIASIYHDFGVPLEKLENLFEKITGSKIKSQIDWSPILLSNEIGKKIENNNNINHIDRLSKIFASKSGKPNILYTKWFFMQLLTNHKHGAFSALMLFDHNWEPDESDILLESALAISLHQYRKDKRKTDFDLGQLKVDKFSLAFFLSFCDLAQEWGRNILLDKIEKLDYQALKNLNHKLESPVVVTKDINKDKIKTDVKIKYSSYSSEIIGKMTLQERLNKIGDEFESTWYLENKKVEFCIACLDPSDHNIKNIYPERPKEVPSQAKKKRSTSFSRTHF